MQEEIIDFSVPPVPKISPALCFMGDIHSPAKDYNPNDNQYWRYVQKTREIWFVVSYEKCMAYYNTGTGNFTCSKVSSVYHSLSGISKKKHEIPDPAL